nr:hypothetical protein [Lebetimonas sp. JH292]
MTESKAIKTNLFTSISPFTLKITPKRAKNMAIIKLIVSFSFKKITDKIMVNIGPKLKISFP